MTEPASPASHSDDWAGESPNSFGQPASQHCRKRSRKSSLDSVNVQPKQEPSVHHANPSNTFQHKRCVKQYKIENRPTKALPETPPESKSQHTCSDLDKQAQAPLDLLTPPVSESDEGRADGSQPEESPDDYLAFPLALQKLSPSSASLNEDLRLSFCSPTMKKQKRSSRCVTEERSPSNDRFVADQFRHGDISRSFRLTKLPQDLNESEKVLRHASASPDPFGPSKSPNMRERGGRKPRNVGRPIRWHRLSPNVVGDSNSISLGQDSLRAQRRQASPGAVWNIGGGVYNAPNGPVRAVSDGRGGFISSGSNAPMFSAQFFRNSNNVDDAESLGNRVAMALDIDRVSRTLNISRRTRQARSASTGSIGLSQLDYLRTTGQKANWINGEWTRPPEFLLDAPMLRDDYYCTVLAFCATARTLAVGLANRVYLWSEELGVRYPPQDVASRSTAYVTSLSFSSAEGGRCILAIGRNTGQLSLWSLHDEGETRFMEQFRVPISCLAFKPVTTRRLSERFGCIITAEELLVGDESGQIYYYAVEWMSRSQADIHGWIGSMKLIARIDMHTQQICGLAWSPGGEFFATGANDNACCLFEVSDIFKRNPDSMECRPSYIRPLESLVGGRDVRVDPRGLRTENYQRINSSNADSSLGERISMGSTIFSIDHNELEQELPVVVGAGRQKHKWIHSAAVKAIAFCPWQKGLIATGGGSNDRAIHFYHTQSGACLATINVFAQVTSLVWSTTRREVAATFGYAQPDHPYRIAVFAWPECKQVVAIPWSNEMRALLAIPYPRGPGQTRSRTTLGETWYSRTAEEGCIVVACSDESVKFHEIWSGASKGTEGRVGLLGGSAILEGLEGVEVEDADVIR